VFEAHFATSKRLMFLLPDSAFALAILSLLAFLSLQELGLDPDRSTFHGMLLFVSICYPIFSLQSPKDLLTMIFEYY
jgi:hypothetical protein